MCRDVVELLDIIEENIDRLTNIDISMVIYDINTILMTKDIIDSSIIGKIKAILTNNNFPRWSQSYKVLRILSENYDIITNEDKYNLMLLLLNNITKFSEPALCILALEIIIDTSIMNNALNLYIELKNKHSMTLKQFLPYMLKYINRKFSNNQERKWIINELKQLTVDKDDNVSKEAIRVLASLSDLE